MSVTYDYYRIFYYVAKYHSFTRAAKLLMNSQPNITRAMNNLEQELGCRLFLRTHKGVTLTPEGEKLFAHVQIAQEHIHAGEAELSSARNLEKGHTSIGASETAMPGLLLPVLREFHRMYPGIRIQITNQSTPQAVEAVWSGAVELAVVTTPTGTIRPLKEIPLMPFREILVSGPGFSQLAGHAVCLKELQACPLVCLGRGTKTREFYDALFAKHGLTLQPDIEVATVDQILPLVKYELGLGFLPEFFAREALEKGEILQVRLMEPIPERSICLVRDSGRPLSAAALALEKALLDQRREG